MIWIAEIGTENDDNNITFQFYERELPESVKHAWKTKVNHIEYPGGHQTNQIIGVYEQPLEWTGIFYGTYRIKGQVVTPKERAEDLKTYMGRPLRFGFPVPGSAAKGSIPGRTAINDHNSKDYSAADTPGEYIIEEFDFDVHDYFNVDYKIKLIPHERQEKIRPEGTTTAKITVNHNNIATATGKIKGKPSRHPSLKKAQKSATAATDFTKTTRGQQGQLNPSSDGSTGMSLGRFGAGFK